MGKSNTSWYWLIMAQIDCPEDPLANELSAVIRAVIPADAFEVEDNDSTAWLGTKMIATQSVPLYVSSS